MHYKIPPEFQRIPKKINSLARVAFTERDADPHSIQRSIKELNIPQAWFQYKVSHAARTIHLLPAWHHSAMLQFCQHHRLPHVGAPIAARIADNMFKMDIPLNPTDYTNIMKSLTSFWFDTMRQMDTRPCIEPYCLTIKSLAKSLDLNAAKRVENLLYTVLPGSQADPRVLATMIQGTLYPKVAFGYAHDVDSAEKIFGLVCRLVSSGKIQPNKQYLNAMIRCCAENNQFEKAEGIYVELFDRHCVCIDLETIDAMLDVYSKSNNLKGAIDLWKKALYFCNLEYHIEEKYGRLPESVKDNIRKKYLAQDIDADPFGFKSNMLSSSKSFWGLRCDFLRYIYNPDARAEIKEKLAPSFIPRPPYEDRRYRTLRPLDSSYSSMLRILANHVPPDNLDALIPIYAMFQSAVCVHEPCKESYDSVVYAHIKAGDYVRALEWYDAMILDRQPEDFTQSQEMTRIRDQILR